MKTFESCNRVWLTMPEDKQMPTGLKLCRGLTKAEMSGRVSYADDILFPRHIGWGYWEGWYPVRPDGTDDHKTAAKFITEDMFTPRPTRKREIRRRFKLSTKRSIINHHP